MSNETDKKKAASAKQTRESEKPTIKVRVNEMIEGARGMTCYPGALVDLTKSDAEKFAAKVTVL